MRLQAPMDDAPVFVIDLRDAVMREVAAEVERAAGGAFVPRVLPAPPEEAIAAAVLLVDERGPVVLPIAPTRDVRWLDALARLIRFAVLRGETVREVAIRYGDAYERALVDEGRLPEWACGALDRAIAARLPPAVRAALGAS